MAKKRLVLCLDGTWNNPYQSGERDDGSDVMKPSNPLKMARAVAPRAADGTEQVTYYDTGVGALGRYPGLSNRILDVVDSKLGGGFGAGFEANIEQAFTFLVNNYTPGDEVYVFGFSRGAAQARGLTRFIDWLGGRIPQKIDAYFVPLYFGRYLESEGRADPDDVKTAGGHGPEAELVPLEIDFLGVWDTVMALGSRFRASVGTSVVSRSFHVGAMPAECVLRARHALAIDERRYDFRPEIWSGAHLHQELRQRWFPGVHSNVGGGYVKDGLANLAFNWIRKEAEALGLETMRDYTKHYRGWHAAQRYESYKPLYSIIEAIRFRRGKGARVLAGRPADARLALDASVIHRLNEEPGGKTQMQERYRPPNVIALLAEQADLDGYLAAVVNKPEQAVLPEDVAYAIELQRA